VLKVNYLQQATRIKTTKIGSPSETAEPGKTTITTKANDD